MILLSLTMLQSGSGVRDVDGVYWTLWSELRFYLLFLEVVWTGLTYRKVVLFCCVWGASAVLAPAAGLPLLDLRARKPAVTSPVSSHAKYQADSGAAITRRRLISAVPAA